MFRRISRINRFFVSIATLIILGYSTAVFCQFSVKKTRVFGQDRVSKATVQAISGISTGGTLTANEINESLKRLMGSGLFKNVEIKPVGNGIDIIVVENPQINIIAFEGNKIFKDDFLLDLIKSKSRDPFNQGYVAKDVQKITSIYREKGRYNATVSPQKIILDDGRINLVFNVQEGKRTEITDILFSGNKAFTDRRLRGAIPSTQKGFFSFFSSSDDYNESSQEKDRIALEKFYHERGFAKASVKSSVGSMRNDRSGFVVSYSIFEGLRYFVREVKLITEVKGFDVGAYSDLIQINSGDVYARSDVRKIVSAIENRAGSLGKPFLKVVTTQKTIDNSDAIILTLELVQGTKLYVERIDIKGNNQTLDRVVRREFSFSEGDAFNPTLIKKTKEKIQALGFFENINVTVREGSTSERAIVAVQVEEAPTGSLNFGAGFSTDTKISGTIALSENNFLGRGQRLKLEAFTSATSTSLGFGFTEPAFLDRDLSASVDINFSDIKPQELSYSSSSSSLKSGFGFMIGPDSRAGLSYEYEEEKIVVPTESTSAVLKSEAGTLSKGKLAFNFIRDARNSIITPTAGYIIRSNLEYAGLGGNSKFIKTSALGKIYNSIFEERLVFTAEVEAGLLTMQKGFSRTTDRFSLGGRKFRGFQYGEIGPREGTQALGGEKFAITRLEANFPLGLPDELGLYGGVFAEIGSLWGLEADTVGSGVVANDLSSIDSSMRSSLGFSIYWATPIGPLQFNWARPQQYLKGVDKTEDFSFNLASRF